MRLCQFSTDHLRLMRSFERLGETPDIPQGVAEIAKRSCPIRRILVGPPLGQFMPDDLRFLQVREPLLKAAYFAEERTEISERRTESPPIGLRSRSENEGRMTSSLDRRVCS